MAVLAGSAIEWACAGELQGLDHLPPGEQYRQLKTLVYLSDGADAEFLALLRSLAGIDGALDKDTELSADAVDSMSGTMERIADPGVLVRGATQVLHLGTRFSQEISSELGKLSSGYPVLVSRVNAAELLEGAILVRTFIADSAESMTAGLSNAQTLLQALARYRQATLKLRNDAEFTAFDQQLSALTEETLEEYGAALDAVQRDVEADSDPYSVRRAASTAARMNKESTEGVQARAAQETEQIYLQFMPMLRNNRLALGY